MIKTLDVTNNTFEKTVLQSPNVVLADFWAPWCGPCKVQLQTLTQLSNEEENLDFIIAKINIDDNENAEISQKYDVRSIPTLLLFKNGEVVETMIGVTSKEILLEKIKAHL